MSIVTERTVHPPSAPIVTLVAAVAENGVIGNGNRMPWHLPADLKRFKALTLGKPILMGRRTFEAIGKPLPGRRNLVLTRATDLRVPGIEIVHSLEEALAAAADSPELMVIGGAEVYRLFLSRATHASHARACARRRRYALSELRLERMAQGGAQHAPEGRAQRLRDDLPRARAPASARSYCLMKRTLSAPSLITSASPSRVSTMGASPGGPLMLMRSPSMV